MYTTNKTKIYDSEGFITEPLLVALASGEHTVSLSIKGEPIRVEKLAFEIPETLIKYEDYAAKYKKHHPEVKIFFDIFDYEAVKAEKQNGDEFKYKMAREFWFKGKIQKIATDVCREITETLTHRQVSYAD